MAAVVLAVGVLGLLLFANLSAAVAATVAGTCSTGGVTVHDFDASTGVASVSVRHPGCRTISLVAYAARPPVDGVASYPQQEISARTVQVTAADGVVELAITPPTCSAQVDLVYGQPLQTLTSAEYTKAGRLIAHQYLAGISCASPTPSVSATTTTTATVPTQTPTTAPTSAASPSAAVLAFSTSRPPVAGAAALPFTGAPIPVVRTVLAGAALLACGSFMIALGRGLRRRAPGTHR
jgi:hypothetical protein